MNQELLVFLESVLGDSEPTSHDNYRFHCCLPDCTSVRKRLEILLEPDEDGNYKWKCWVCNRGGKTLRSLFKQGGIPEDKIRRLNEFVSPRSKAPKKPSNPEFLDLPSNFTPLVHIKNENIIGRQALSYMRSRGFSDEELIKYNIGYCPEGRYENRVIVPSYDQDANLNYFIARTWIQDHPRKYDNPPLSRDIVPFELYINWNAPITLCEGFFDMKAIMRNAIPLLGKGISPALMKKLLSKTVTKIYIVLDKDAMREALDHAQTLMNNGKKVYLVELDDKDPSEMGFDKYTRMIQQAKVLSHGSLLTKKMAFKLR